MGHDHIRQGKRSPPPHLCSSSSAVSARAPKISVFIPVSRYLKKHRPHALTARRRRYNGRRRRENQRREDGWAPMGNGRVLGTGEASGEREGASGDRCAFANGDRDTEWRHLAQAGQNALWSSPCICHCNSLSVCWDTDKQKLCSFA